MYRKTFTVLSILLVMALATGPVLAQSRSGSQDHGSQDRHGSNHSNAAVAHLQAVGDADGWGRVMITDTDRNDASQLAADIRLFGLESEETYTIEVDGVLLAEVVTDTLGDGWFHLGAGPGDDQPIPAGLPAVSELASAIVFDSGMVPTLAGDFQSAGSGSSGWGHHEPLVYAERIFLDNAESYWPRGMARVGRSGIDDQHFETHAGGLEPGVGYIITVDSVLAGTVTADTVGHAYLRLDTADEESGLPPELRPIEDLRVVEWTTRDGNIVLTGSFTGESQIGSGHGDGDHGGHGGSDGDDHGHDGGRP